MHTGHQTSKQAETAVPRAIEIELLALDLTSCTRCVGTLENIERAIDTVRPVLEVTGAQVNVRRLVIESEEQARQYRFVTSPTVRINGKDIAFSRPLKASATLARTCADATKARIAAFGATRAKNTRKRLWGSSSRRCCTRSVAATGPEVMAPLSMRKCRRTCVVSSRASLPNNPQELNPAALRQTK